MFPAQEHAIEKMQNLQIEQGKIRLACCFLQLTYSESVLELHHAAPCVGTLLVYYYCTFECSCACTVLYHSMHVHVHILPDHVTHSLALAKKLLSPL